VAAVADEGDGAIDEELATVGFAFVLKRMVKLGDGTQPFSQESVEYYRSETGNHRVTTPSVQKALDVLVVNNFVWRSSRGVYALDDVTVAEFFYDEAIHETLLRELDSRALSRLPERGDLSWTPYADSRSLSKSSRAAVTAL
jgi:hypothetical protein